MEVENPQLSNLSQSNPLNTENNQQNQPELKEDKMQDDSTTRTQINTNTEAKENGQAKMEILDSHNTLNSGKPPRIFVYGSCECDQFSIDGIKFITKKPIEISSYFTDIKKTVYSIACGELHTVFLLTNGDVYTSGCNDFHALGRSGDPSKPGKVELEFPIDMIAAGELHSVACNSTNSIVYQWGVYRNSQRRNVSTTKAPSLIGEEEFSNKKIKKVLSGLNHSMLLADGKVFLWGNLEDGVIGKNTSGRRNTKTRLNVAELNAPGVEDIFTGGQHCFLVQKKKKNSKKKEEEETTLLAFGNNEFGQLGVKTRKKTLNLTEAKEVKDLGIKDIKGGKNHTIILTNDGNVYGLGHNEKGELGTTLEVADDKLKEYPDTMVFETNGHTRNNVLVSTAVPLKLELSNIQQIFSGPNYNYAIDAEQKVYSWGIGDNYLLGDRKEEIVFKAKQIDNDFLEGKPLHFGLGFQHVISMTVEDVPAHLRLNEEVFKAYEEADLAEKKKLILERMQKEEPVAEEEKKEEEIAKAKPSTRGRGKAKEEAKMEEEDEKDDETEEEEEEVEETKKTRGKSKGTKKEIAKKDEKKSTKSGSKKAKAKADEDEIEDEEEEEGEKESKKTRGRSQGAKKETEKGEKKATRSGSKKVKADEDEMEEEEEEEEEEKKEPKKTRGRSQTVKKIVNPKKGIKQEKSQSKGATKKSTGKQQKSVSTDKKKGKENARTTKKKEPEVKASAQRNAKKRKIEMDEDDDGELKKVKRTTRSKSVTGKARSKSGASKRK